MNLVTQFGVSILMTAGIWLAGRLVHRRNSQLAKDAGVEWPAEDVGLEVSPGLLRAIAITDLLHRIRWALLGPLFGFSFLCVNWLSDRLI